MRCAWPTALLLALLGGCRSVTVPYPIDRVGLRTQALQMRTIALLPFEDGRRGPDRDGDERVFMYQGVAHDSTRLADLRGTPERALSELLARHLVRAGVFARVLLVDDAKEAPEAELFLTARIRRARGYVEANARDDAALKRRQLTDAQRHDRSVLAEVWLEDVTVYARGAPDRPLLRADVGWSIAEERPGEPEAPDPWTVLADALVVAYGQAASLLGAADLGGSVVVEDRVSLDTATSTTPANSLTELREAVPSGWRAGTVTSTRTPIGWRARDTRCSSLTLTARQTQRFHRVLGPYVPAVDVWWCSGGRLSYDVRAEFPAVYLGRTPTGGHLFVHALGTSSWLDAPAQLARFFAVEKPTARYVFEVGP